MMRRVLSIFSSDRMKRFLSAVCAVVLFAAGLEYSSRLFVNKQSIVKYRQFFETDKDFDVLFVGSSHVINGVSPLDLFKDYGITSYNLAMHGNYVRSGYYLAAQALDIMEEKGQKLPEAVVFDIYADGEDSPALHNAWDGFGFSKVKREMAGDLGDSKETELLAPFILYHSRWNGLGKADFKPQANVLYGAEPRYGVSLPGEEIITEAADKADIGEDKLEYVDKMRELCQSKGIRLVLIHIPYSYNPAWQREANSFYEYGLEHDLRYVNYMNEDTGIDFDIDFCDPGHLNPVGMRKMTGELGKLLRELGVGDRRDGAMAEVWMNEYKEYTRFRINKLSGIADVKTYLMSICDPDLICRIQVRQSMLLDVQIRKLIEQLDNGENQIVIVEEGLLEGEEKEGDFDIFCTVYERENPANPVHSAGFSHEESVKKK